MSMVESKNMLNNTLKAIYVLLYRLVVHGVHFNHIREIVSPSNNPNMGGY
jgi:hypothetical protein